MSILFTRAQIRSPHFSDIPFLSLSLCLSLAISGLSSVFLVVAVVLFFVLWYCSSLSLFCIISVAACIVVSFYRLVFFQRLVNVQLLCFPVTVIKLDYVKKEHNITMKLVQD